MLRTRYWVSPVGERWTVSREDQVLARYPERSSAIVAAVSLAQSDLPSELFIKDTRDEIEEHRAFDDEGSPTDGVRERQERAAHRARFPVIERTEDQVTLLVEGDLADEPWLVQMTRALLDEIEVPGLERLIVDMSGVTKFNVQSVAGWVGLEHFVRQHGRTLSIVNASPAVLTVLDRMSVGHDPASS